MLGEHDRLSDCWRDVSGLPDRRSAGLLTRRGLGGSFSLPTTGSLRRSTAVAAFRCRSALHSFCAILSTTFITSAISAASCLSTFSRATPRVLRRRLTSAAALLSSGSLLVRVTTRFCGISMRPSPRPKLLG